jgi:hypothetical protein
MVAAACSTTAAPSTNPPVAVVPVSTTTTQAPTTTRPTTTTISPFARPAWLGTQPLPLRADGFGEVQPTPPELVDRRLETIDRLPPPAADEFESTLGPIPDDVLARSSW